MIRSAKDYGFLNVRIRAQRMELFTAGTYNVLVNATDIDNLSQMLENTRYKDIIGEAISEQYINLIAIDRRLTQHFADQFNYYRQFIPNRAEAFINAYSRRFYFNNIEVIINALHGTGGSSMARDLLITLSEEENEGIEHLLGSRDIQDLIQRLQDDRLRQILEEAYEDYKILDLVYPLINAIDHYYYELLGGEIEALSSTDKKPTHELFGTKIDLQNIETILRSKFFAIPTEQVKSWLITKGNLLKMRILEQLIEPVELEDSIKLLKKYTVYGDLADRLLDNIEHDRPPIENYDKYADQIVAHKANTIFSGVSFNIAIFPAFFFLKEFELRNIRTLILGKIDKRSPQEILDKIVIV